MPKVLHVVESYAGGVASAVDQYASTMTGAEHYLLRSDRRAGSSKASGDTYQEVFDLPRSIFRAIRCLRSLTSRHDFEVIHAHSSWAGGITRLAIEPGTRNVVYSPHCYAFEKTSGSATRKWAVREIEKRLARRQSTVAACSQHEANLARDLGAPRVVYVPNVASRGNAGPRLHSNAIGFVGRLTSQKDPLFAARVVEDLGDHPIVHIGDGEARYRDALEARGVKVLGWVVHEEAIRELSKLRVYLHTAAWEGFPIAVLEAAASGVPIVVRRLPCFDNPLLAPFSVNEPREMAAIARRLYADGGFRSENIAAWRDALSDNNPENQLLALRRAYQWN